MPLANAVPLAILACQACTVSMVLTAPQEGVALRPMPVASLNECSSHHPVCPVLRVHEVPLVIQDSQANQEMWEFLGDQDTQECQDLAVRKVLRDQGVNEDRRDQLAILARLRRPMSSLDHLATLDFLANGVTLVTLGDLARTVLRATLASAAGPEILARQAPSAHSDHSDQWARPDPQALREPVFAKKQKS